MTNVFKKVKRPIAMLLLVMTLLNLLTIPAGAEYSHYNDYSFNLGVLWWKETFTAKVYRDPTYFIVFAGTAKTSSGFEYKNNGQIILQQTRSFSIGAQTKSSLSAGVDFKSYGVPANVGGSIERTGSASWGVTNSSARTIESNAPKGYYSYNVCINVYKIKVEKYAGSAYKGSIQFYAPRSQPYRAIVYNRNNASYSGVSFY